MSPKVKARAPVTHQLKIWPQFFDAWRTGKKRAEIRKNDRDYRVGDVVVLNEWDPKKGKGGTYTRRALRTEILNVTHLSDVPGTHKSDGDFVVLSLASRKITRLPPPK